MTTTNYKNAYKEVYVILSYLNEEEYLKIPFDILNTIKNNMNEDYIYEMNRNIDLSKQEMLVETKAILFNLFRDYLSEPWQKEKIISIQKKERLLNEIEKKQQYNTDIFANKKIDDVKNIDNRQAESLVKYKKSFFEKLINKIKQFFYLV